MNVTVFVPIQMIIEGIDKESEVRRVLNAMESIISQSELEADPCINVELVGEAEIVVDDEQTDEEIVNNERVGLTKKEKAILSSASEYLSVDEEDDLIFMVASIVNNEDQDELIDNIEGVCVWQKVEFEFTAKEFCELIGCTGTEFKTK